MRKQAINEQRQRKHRENTLIDYKDNEKQQTNSMGNSNEIRPLPTRNEGAASGEEDPHKLSNNFSKNEVLKRQKQLKKDLEVDWIRNSPLYNENSNNNVYEKIRDDALLFLENEGKLNDILLGCEKVSQNSIGENPLSEGEVGERRSEMMVEKKIHKC